MVSKSDNYTYSEAASEVSPVPFKEITKSSIISLEVNENSSIKHSITETSSTTHKINKDSFIIGRNVKI